MTFPHFAACQQTLTIPAEMQYTNTAIAQTEHQPEERPEEQEQKVNTINNSPQVVLKKKRSVNPQADENFIRALEAVRFGGIGFCKAARMYGVNNRTLWLEYKKRGYPISRLSIKNRKQEFSQQNQQSTDVSNNATVANNTPTNPPPIPTSQENNEQYCISNPVTMISQAFLDGRPVDIAPVFQRSRYFDGGVLNTSQAVNMGLSFDHIT